MKRVFIGYICGPLPELLLTVDKLKDTFQRERIKWTYPDSWHITSHFIGGANVGEIKTLKEIVSEIAGNAKGFSVNVTGIGFFPSASRPKVLWAGVDSKDDLTKLYHKTGALLRSEGFNTATNPYNPHITLARISHCVSKELASEVEQLYEKKDFGILHVSKIILFESRLFPTGARYTPMFSAEMR